MSAKVRLAITIHPAYPPTYQRLTELYQLRCTKGATGRMAMPRITKTIFAAAGTALLAVCGVLGQRPLLGEPADAHDADRAAISAVLKAQQAAWNRGDVDAFLVGYWQSPELTFSGSNGVSRGWDGVLARYKRNYPNR